MALEGTRVLHKWGGGRGHTGGKKLFAHVHEKIFWRSIYCANPRPNSRSHLGYWSLRGFGSRYPWIICEYDLATAISIRPLIQTRTCEMGSSISAAMSWLKFSSTSRASLPSMPSTEITNGGFFYVVCGSSYRAYIYSFSPTHPGALPLDQTCRYLRQHPQVWCRLWRWSVCPISPGWVRHPLSPICHSSDVSPPLIFCDPGVWGVSRVQRLKGRLMEKVIGVRCALHCDVRWQGLLFCIYLCDVHQRIYHSRRIFSEG